MKYKNSIVVCILIGFLGQGCMPVQPDQPTVTAISPVITELSPTLPQQKSDTRSVSPTHQSIQVDENGPLSVVQSFYDWYLSQPQGEVLTKRTYESNPHISAIGKSDIGYLLESFDKQAGYDPFTCAQNLIPSLTFEPVFISAGEASALGYVEIDGNVEHYFVVQLGKSEGDWKIDAVRCPFDPQTTAIAFYTWYLGSIYQGVDASIGIETPRNPIVENLLKNSYLTSSLYLEQLNVEIQTMKENGGAYDPVLLSQSLPTQFWVEPGQEGNAITVRLTYGPQSVRYFIVHLVKSEKFYWVIDNIEPVEVPELAPLTNMEVDTSEWNVYQNERYQFSLQYPQNWKPKAADLSAMPGDNPVKEGVFFLANWADPNLPILWLHVLEGSEDQLNNYYVTENRQQIDISGQTVWVDRDRVETRFVFQNPKLENVWIVLSETGSSMAGRERYAEELNQFLWPLLRSVIFK